MKKINILFISGISAIILFLVLTLLQNRIIKNDNMHIAYISTRNIARDSKISEKDYSEVLVPSSLIINTDSVISSKDLQEKYTKESINKGQIIFYQDIASKEELKIIDKEAGLEKIAVKIKSAENSIAYQIKPKDRIHLYFTGKSNVIEDTFLRYGISFENTKNNNSLQTVKILENTEILGIYDENGRGYENADFSKPDTIVIAVEPIIAEMVNNLRNQGTFDITG